MFLITYLKCYTKKYISLGNLLVAGFMQLHKLALEESMSNNGESASMNKRTSMSVKKQRAIVYPMMSRKYTAVQRARLRRFEKELLKDKRVVLP